MARALRLNGDDVIAVPRDRPDLAGADAVVHLAGAPIVVRWTARRKREILESRVLGTRRIVDAIANQRPAPRVLVCASAIGFYGDRGGEELTEESGPGRDFLADVVREWERAAQAAPVRSVQLRFGIVLSPRGGALAKMLPAFRLGVGGRLGSGTQWMSWIALHDLVRVIRFAIDSETLTGPVNAVAPQPVTNAEFTATLARVVRRPAVFPVPAFALRTLFGEMAGPTMLASQRVNPRRLEMAGFRFECPTLEEALRHELAGLTASSGVRARPRKLPEHMAISSVNVVLTDFHNHLVPGVDDGARQPADSSAALVRYRAEGVTQIITTPHFEGSLTRNRARFEARLAELDAGWELLRAAVATDAARAGSALRVERGVEVMLDMPDPDLSDDRLRLAGGPFVLVEYPMLRVPPVNAEYALVELQARGWTPVIAHPERYRNLDPTLVELARFRAAGAYHAMNAGSLFGVYGKIAAGHARRILMAGEADYVASDYHARGEPGLRRFVQAMTDAGFSEQAELLTMVNPGRLLAGEPPLRVPPIQVKAESRSLWSRLFG